MENNKNWPEEKEKWIALVKGLCNDIKSWAQEENWFVSEQEKRITEKNLGSYSIAALLIQTPQGRIHVDPIGRDVVEADGRVDITSFPGMNRMLLIRKKDKWVLKTDSLIKWPEPWSKEAFLNLVMALTVE